MSFDELIIERLVEATLDGLAVIDPIHGVGVGIALGFFMGWITRSMTIYLFKRTERGA